jgi:choice-of-anchor B domain-containing protein
MKKASILFLLIFFLRIDLYSQQNTNLLFHWEDTTLVGSNAYNNTYNEIWGLNINGSEIAVIGSTAGTHFFDVTNPQNSSEVAFVAGAYTGPGVIHRDYHDFDGYLYIVCDEGSPSTLQIVDISNLPTSVNIVYDSNNLLNKVHNIFIDTATAKLYACATGEAMEVFSLTNPNNPTLIYTYNDVGHVHDAYVKNDTAFLNCGNDGLRIMDFTMVNNSGDTPVELASYTSYPDAGYNHSGWLTDDGTIYAMQDENHGYDVKMLDVSDYSNISVLATFNSGVDPNSMAHNGIIKDDFLYLAYYHDGLRVFDISNPSNPVQVNYYDTYLPNNHNSYKGAWGVYPYLNSGNILVSDMQTGLYVFELTTSPTEIKEEKKPSYIYPNPITSSFIINNLYADLIIMYDVFGRAVRTEKLNKNINIFNRNDIKDGLYLIEFYKEGLLLSSDKIIFN